MREGTTLLVLSIVIASTPRCTLQATTVGELKQQVNAKDAALLPYLQRLTFQGPDGNKILQEEDQPLLSSYNGVTNGTVLLLIVLTPFELYVQGVDGRMFTITVKSAQPDSYPISSLMRDVEEATHCSLRNYQLHFQEKTLLAVRHGKTLTLRDYRIKKEETLFISKIGFSLDITNPQVDLCFLVDCTGSMGGHIEAVKNNVKQLRDDLVQQYKGCDIRFAFVRYTDYDVKTGKTTYINFTNDQAAFHSFVSCITASGGGDAPEDIMGGLKVAFSSLSWRDGGAKVLVHIADCPCHGTMYHDNDMGDTYPGGDPSGISHEQMMAKVRDQEVDYWFGYINRGYTDKMISVFNDCLQRISNQRFLIRQFDAMQPTEVRASVHRSVSASIYGSEAAKRARMRAYKLDSTIPDWNSTALIETYGKKTPAVGMKSLHDLQMGLDLESPSLPITFKCAPNPFSEGTECLVYHGFDLTTKKAVVLKKYKREGAEYNSLDCYRREIEVRTICSTYATDFNASKTKPPATARIDVIPVDVVQCPGEDHYLLEAFLGGKIEKYSNNSGLVCSKSSNSELLQAFSHYSWVASGKSLVICDLQGVESGTSRVTLTDPAIHSTSAGTYGHTDLGNVGIQQFFKTHTCGAVCTGMGLSSHLL